MTALRRLGAALRRLVARPQPTTFHRCLAVHLYHCDPNRSALDG